MPADAHRALRDPALPGLPTLLDPDAFAELLHAFAPEAQLAGVRGEYVRYKPGARCIASYRIALRSGEVRVHGIAHGADAHEKLAKRRQQPAVEGPLGAGRFVREDQALTVEVFPNDARLRALRRLGSADFRGRLMTRLGVLAPGSAVQQLTPLAYKPERRFVARVDVDDGSRALLKLHTPERFLRAHAAFRGKSRNSLRVARPHEASRRHAALAYEWIDGRLLAPFAADAREALARAGEALAELHAQPPVPRERCLGSEVLASAALVAVLIPKLADCVRALAERIAANLTRVSSPVRALHGDFHAAQVLIDGDTAALLDLDNACAGDPSQDLAVFTAHAELEAMRSHRTPDCVETALGSLLAGYAQVAGPLDPCALALHTAAALVSLAPQPFRSFDPAWPERIEALLDRSRAWIERAGCASPRAPAAVARVSPSLPVDPGLPLLADALDRRRLEATLGDALAEPRLRLHSAELIRHKPGRRALVEYTVTSGSGVSSKLLGKLRARGLDRAALRIQETLYRSTFGDDTPDAVCVPETLGAIPELSLWLQRKVPGVRVTERLGQSGDAAVCERVADALHKLHGTAIATPRRHTLSDEIELLCDRLLPRLAHTHPALAVRSERLAGACRRLAATIPDGPQRGIHRDFHPDQLLVDGERMWLVDFDLYCSGHPALDAGNFVAHLTELALRRFGDPSALADCEHAFRQRFLMLAGRELEGALGGYTLLALARHVYLSTRYEDRRATTEPLLALCESRLAANGATAPALLGSFIR